MLFQRCYWNRAVGKADFYCSLEDIQISTENGPGPKRKRSYSYHPVGPWQVAIVDGSEIPRSNAHRLDVSQTLVNPMGFQLPTSTGGHRISEPSTVWFVSRRAFGILVRVDEGLELLVVRKLLTNFLTFKRTMNPNSKLLWQWNIQILKI